MSVDILDRYGAYVFCASTKHYQVSISFNIVLNLYQVAIIPKEGCLAWAGTYPEGRVVEGFLRQRDRWRKKGIEG